MIAAYASRTGTKRNLRALRLAGWRLMVSAYGVWRTEGFRCAVDNGAWSAHQSGQAWDAGRFRGVLDRLGDEADFVIAPDVVAGGLASLRLSESWLPDLKKYRLVLIPVQDGMIEADVMGLLDFRTGLFLGGSTGWKIETMDRWGDLAADVGCYYHVGRVNSVRRIHHAATAGADSFDGSGPSRYAVEVMRLDQGRAQEAFKWR